MARLACGAKCGGSGSPPMAVMPRARSAETSDASAAVPRPRAPRRKKWRRVIRLMWSWIGCMSISPRAGGLRNLPPGRFLLREVLVKELPEQPQLVSLAPAEELDDP